VRSEPGRAGFGVHYLASPPSSFDEFTKVLVDRLGVSVNTIAESLAADHLSGVWPLATDATCVT
jgi:hypothetical protein